MEWQSQLGKQLTSPAEAVSVLKSGDHLAFAPFTTTPFTLCAALYERRNELEGVHIDHPAGLFSWVRPHEPTPFHIVDNYATAMNREMVNSGHVDYLPIARWRADEIAPGYDGNLDAFLVPAVGHGHARPQTYIFRPRRNDEALDEAPLFTQVAINAPACSPIAAPHRLDRLNIAQECFAMLGIDPVFELDQDRTVVGQRLDGDREVR